MIRSEALARGRLFSRLVIFLAGLLAVLAMIQDAAAAASEQARLALRLGDATPLSADLAIGTLCLLAAALLVWIAGRRPHFA